MRKLIKVISIIVIVFGSIGVILTLQNTDALHITRYVYESSKVTNDFSGFKIVQLSDLHNHDNKYSNDNLVDLVNKENPDVIFITGDMIDTHTEVKNIEAIDTLYSSLSGYPIYLVDGNHENYASYREEYYSILDKYSNIHYLHDEVTTYNIGESSINILGLHDPREDFDNENFLTINEGKVPTSLKAMVDSIDNNDLKILLSHRPELMETYVKNNMDIVFSGHTHGGQVTLFGYVPFVVNQFPAKYIGGEYKENNTTMYLSRGLGNSYNFPVRLMDDLEIVVTTLYSKD